MERGQKTFRGLRIFWQIIFIRLVEGSYLKITCTGNYHFILCSATSNHAYNYHKILGCRPQVWENRMLVRISAQMKRPPFCWRAGEKSNINVWFPFMYNQKWNCYFQNRIIMFCLPFPTLIDLWEIYIFPGSVWEIWGPILGTFKSLTDTWMCKLGLRPRNSLSENT